MAQDSLESQDPFDWSIEEVVAYLCHASFDSWTRSKISPPRPNPDVLEKALRENDVTGHVLLTEINKQTLIEDFGLKSLGQRATIIQAVQYLQGLSQKYKEYHDTSIPSSTPFALPQNGPQLPRVARPSVQPQEHFQKAEPSASTLPHLNATALIDMPAQGIEDESLQPPVTKSAPVSKDDALSLALAPSLPMQNSTDRRHKEHYVVNKDGKKRRKLDPDALITQPAEPQPRGRRYLEARRSTVSDIFYSGTIGAENESDEDTFCMFGTASCPTGHQLFVNQKMRYSLRQRPQYLKTKDGKPVIAVFPYRATPLLNGGSRFFSLFVKKGKKVIATKEDIFDWPEFDLGDDRLQYLLSKYPPKDENDALPVYGDSASEDDYDSETWNEIDQENQQKEANDSTQSKILPPEEVDAVIDSCIAEFIDKWQLQKRPLEDRKARRIWLRSSMNRTQLADINTASTKISHMNHRLKELRKAVKVTPWSRVKDVRLQCQSMEQTVFELEHQKWVIATLELEKCPPNSIDRPKVSKPLRRPQLLDDDEESLGSDTSNDANDPDDFVVPDDQPADHDRGVEPELFPPFNPDIAPPDDGDDVLSPRKKVKLQRARRAANNKEAKTATPTSNTISRNSVGIEVVDLTISDNNEDEKNGDDNSRRERFDVRTPPLNPSEASHRQNASSLRLDDLEGSTNTSVAYAPPTNLVDLDLDRIMSLTTEELQLDRTVLLAWHVHNMPAEDREGLIRFFSTTPLKVLKGVVVNGLQNMLARCYVLPGYNHEDSEILMRIVVMYVSWIVGKRLFADKGISKYDIKYSIRKRKVRQYLSLLADILRLYPFKKTREKKEKEPSTEAIPEETVTLDTSDDLSGEEAMADEQTRTPHKKRKRAVKQSQEAIDTQKRAQRRVQLQEEQQLRLQQRLERSGVANSDPGRQAVSFDEPIIYLDAHIGRRVKAHQLQGIQFMWRELIKDEKREGCLLAHTMGLGKTMQVISLLVTIANAANSPDAEIRKQIPECFRQSRTLILCPSSLIENWWEEFLTWRPPDPASMKNLGPVRKVLVSAQLGERLDEITAWHSEGGVLLISYDIFRVMVLNRSTKARPCPFEPEEHAAIKRQLVEGPNIVVADEAHKMKNRGTGIAEASTYFKSKSRIALTGSPLANHLEEYYSMINWIAPNYLGDFVQFRAKYVEPIEAGLYVDSTRYERRESLKRLQVLKKDLDPKVNRADISVLEGDIPPKVEFVITLPLTPLQEDAYKIYVASLATRDDVPMARLWAWLAILSLLCNHPSCFVEKLLKKNNGKKAKSLQQDSEYESFAEDIPVTQVLTPDIISELQRVFEGISELESTTLSHRAKMLEQIVEESIKAEDRVLVFSHSIPTLNYLERVLKKNVWRYSRLDGATPIGTRQASTKYFNRADSPMQVYLISTKAGGLGLNIPGANRVVIFDFAFNPTWEEQAVGRAYRFGQTKPVFVYRFIAGGTYEDAMYNKTVFKTQLSFRVVDKKNPIRYASKSKKAYLFPPKEVKQQDLSEFKGKDPKVLDKILEQPNFVREIALTETFQREDNDKLTPEEEQAVQAELDDERLKRNDPAAWERKQIEIQKTFEATLAMKQPYTHANNVRFSQPTPKSPMVPSGTPPLRFPGPISPGFDPRNRAHGVPSSSAPQPAPQHSGPPPLQPDTSLFAVPSSQPTNAQMATFTSLSTNIPRSSRLVAPPRSPLTQSNGSATASSPLKNSIASPAQLGTLPQPPANSPNISITAPTTASTDMPGPGRLSVPPANKDMSTETSTQPPTNTAGPVRPSVTTPQSSSEPPHASSSSVSTVTSASSPTKISSTAEPDNLVKSPAKQTVARKAPRSFDGVFEEDQPNQGSSDLPGHSPKTPNIEQNPTRCATQ
ncbi:hypothetical protein PRK78_002052 [Emydomyces testavorans]|uniref:SNF2 family helicase/ATPase n=1 Tax=Emydomyces testavorans TaxID=2070801 RepID=A0AAF0IG37_9EURO|nr:hypothetical protein PRK78_002052 [Emydomyces testavorans]